MKEKLMLDFIKMEKSWTRDKAFCYVKNVEMRKQKEQVKPNTAKEDIHVNHM